MPELRILALVAPHLPRVALAALIAFGAEASGIALVATAAWLLASAAGQPPITELTVAIAAVRAFAISRGSLRYLDRLVGHDAVLRALASLRGTVFAALTPLAPGGAAVFDGGDLLSRLTSDVDSIQDLVLRVITPMWTAFAVCVAAVGFTAVWSPPAAAVLACGLLLAGVVLPAAAARGFAASAQRPQAAVRPFAPRGQADDSTADARGALSASMVDLMAGSADLV
ncbi:MAG: ABC transporter transmembrane domain-containing protein, partial [Stackebrandtia sp.]